MDDAYIHLVYGRNLAEHGLLTFNLSPPDHGIGTTSILWTLLLAALHPLMGVAAAARLLGAVAGLAVVALGAIVLTWMVPEAQAGRRRWAAVLPALSGNLLWFSLSGMETMLWLALGLGAVVAYRSRRFAVVGLLLGLMTLTRVEGVVLLAAIWLVDLVVQRKFDRGLLVVLGLTVALWTPWLAVVHAKTGHWMPTSFSGKKQAQVRGAIEVIRRSLPTRGGDGSPTRLDESHLPWWVHLIYPSATVGYGAAFVAGAGYLPGPKLGLSGPMGEVTSGLSLLGLLALLAVFMPCLLVAVRRVGRVLTRVSTADERTSALYVLLVWFVLHNLAYWVKLPTPGTASRYQVVNHVAWWLLAGAGAIILAQKDRLARWLLPALVVLALGNAVYWRGVYGSNCRHMQQVRLAAADHIAQRLPATAVVAAHDIGAIGWAGQHRLLDLGGLIDPAYLEQARHGKVRDWLMQCGATHVVLPDKHTGEGTGFYDYAAFLGLDAAHGLRLVPLAHFENDYNDYRVGAAATWNALPGVTLYTLEWLP